MVNLKNIFHDIIIILLVEVSVYLISCSGNLALRQVICKYSAIKVRILIFTQLSLSFCTG